MDGLRAFVCTLVTVKATGGGGATCHKLGLAAAGIQAQVILTNSSEDQAMG